MKLTDIEAMRMAIEIAKDGNGFVSPNPQVGCVVLNSEGELLSQGFHEVYGGPHAEVNALKSLSPEQLKGAKVFVTLEPCAHFGKTPPCADMIAGLPIAELIYGIEDPNPAVSGKGAQKVRDAGIKVTLFADLSSPLNSKEISAVQTELNELCEVFLWNQKKQLPFVSLKVGTSLDGMLGLKSGESKWITGPTSRTHAHFLRATHDVILIGANTLLSDNPSLNVRHDRFKDKMNKVFILDPWGRGLEFLRNSQILKTHPADFTFVFVQEGFNKNNNLDKFPFQIVECPVINKQTGEFDLNFVLKKAWDLNCKSILVEGGAQTLSAFIKQKLGNRLFQFVAPCVIGANSGKSWSEGLQIPALDQKVQLENLKSLPMRDDILLTASFNYSTQANSKSGFTSQSGATNTQGSTNTSSSSSDFSQDNPAGDFSSQGKKSIEYKFVRAPNGLLFGVCQGLGESFGLNPVILRILWFFTFFYYFLGVGLYLALAISLPRKDRLDKALKRQILGVCATISLKSDIEVGLVRLLALLLLFFTGGLAFLFYVILYFAFEDKSKKA